MLDVPFHASASVVAVCAQVRQQLKNDGYKSGRISQLLKATRPVGPAAPAQAAVAASSVVARPAEDVSWRRCAHVACVAFAVQTLKL